MTLKQLTILPMAVLLLAGAGCSTPLKIDTNNTQPIQPIPQLPQPVTVKSNVLCTKKSEVTASGREEYPIATQYAQLYFLGQLFTAAECGSERLSKISGVQNNTYTQGARVSMKNGLTSSAALQAFLNAGFVCSQPGIDEFHCSAWVLNKDVEINKLLPLKAFVSEFSSDDCIKCG